MPSDLSEAPSSEPIVHRIAAHYVLRVVDPRSAFLLSETARIPVTGKDHVALLCCLERGASDFDLQRAAGSELPLWLLLLEQYAEAGYVVSAAAKATDGVITKSADGAAAVSTAAVDTAALDAAWRASLGHALPNRPVSIANLGQGACPEVLETFAADVARSGLELDSAASVQLLLVNDYRDPEVVAGIRALAHSGRTIIPCKPMGASVWLGPTLGSPPHGCWDCLTYRLLDNSPVETSLHRATGRSAYPARPLYTPRSLAVAAAFVTTRLLASGVLRDASAPLALTTFDFSTFTTREHAAILRPQCPTCGDSGLMARRGQTPVVLTPARKQFTHDGGHRVMSPDDTLRRIRKHVDPLTGLLSNAGPIRGRSDHLRHVYGATHFTTPVEGDAHEAQRFEMLSVGKGKTASQAEASALCEALERKCARYQGDEARLLARYVDLEGQAISPSDLLLFSEQQFAGSVAHARSDIVSPRSQRVPLRFNPERETWWTPVWSLTHGCQRYVPLAYGFAGTPFSPPGRDCNWDSNGCAAGNCLEEAILQGLLELVERDAAAVYWYNRIRRPGVPLDAYGDSHGAHDAHSTSYAKRAAQLYSQLGYDLWVLDITHDLEIPTFFAMSRERSGTRFAAGLGCHLDPKVALQRALSELHQVFDPQKTAPPLWDLTAVTDPSYLYPSSTEATPHKNVASDDIAKDVSLVVERLRKAGLDTLVLDYTRPDADVFTVKAIVPGLRHFWPRYAPGRLYDVPVRLGWRTSPLNERELNPLALEM